MNDILQYYISLCIYLRLDLKRHTGSEQYF